MSEGGGAEAVKHAETHQFSLVKFTGKILNYSSRFNREITWANLDSANLNGFSNIFSDLPKTHVVEIKEKR